MVEATIEANPPHPTNPTVLRGNGVKNLHGSKTIPKSLYEAF